MKPTAQIMLRLLLIGALLGSLTGCVVRAQPATVTVGVPAPVAVRAAPPPPPRNAVVVAPAPRPGYVFVRGHYQWAGSRWVWVRHRYVPIRAGHRFVQPHYDSARGVWVRGHWVRGRAVVRTAPARRRAAPPARVVRPAPRRRAPAPPPPPSPPR